MLSGTSGDRINGVARPDYVIPALPSFASSRDTLVGTFQHTRNALLIFDCQGVVGGHASYVVHSCLHPFADLQAPFTFEKSWYMDK